MSFSSDQVLIIILSIIIFEYALGTLVDWLNMRKKSQDIPDEVADLYDADKYANALRYQKENTRFGLVSGVFSFVVLLLVVATGLLGVLNDVLKDHFQNVITHSLAFFGVIFFVNDIINLPFQWYSTFHIEEKYGFNKMTKKIFFQDKLKGYLLTIIIGGILVGLLVWLITTLGFSFWWIFWIVITVFMIGMNFFYTSWIMPLFNKLTPLEEGELRTAIINYADKVDFPLTNIFVMDGSKRSSKANAFFSGFGNRKKIVLYDTLMEKHTNEELVAILAHEVGHYKKKHTVSGLITGVLQVGVMLFIMAQMIFSEELSIALGAAELSFPVNFIAFGMLYTPISLITGLILNYVSRKHEFEADEFATKTYNGEALKMALKKLSVHSMSNLTPHKWYVTFHYSHPPLLQRLHEIDRSI